MTPSHIGQYRIVRKIGAGGMGLVFLGEHTLLGRRAAIKTLLPSVAANHEIVERFFNEARATSAISDPGVIQVFDFGYHVDGTAYIVMELLEGESLSARIERLGKLSLVDALRIGRQIAGSLGVAHAHAIIHRDLKPENIFLVPDAEAQGGERTKILDFGICKMGDATDAALTQSGVMIGTPVYMSPEQCRGAGGIDQRSDIYAFGCLVFHMLTGRPPFVREAPGELIVAHLQEEPAAPSAFVSGLPAGVDALVARCLAKRADDRFQSMAEVHAALGELYAQLDVAESTVDTVTPAVPLGRGFRSVYDGNFSRTGGIRNTPGMASRMPWLQYAPPARGSEPRFTEVGGVDDDDDVIAPRRSRLRALLAGVLVAGVLGGVGVTSYLLYSARDSDASPAGEIAVPSSVAPVVERHREDAEVRRQARVKPERAAVAVDPPAVLAPHDTAPAAHPEPPAPGATDAAVAAAAPSPSAAELAAPDSADEADEADDQPAPAAEPPAKHAAPDRGRRPREAKKRSAPSGPRSAPVTSPAQVPSAAPRAPVAAPSIATPPAMTSTPVQDAPPTRPASPTEDLYDAR
jgi:serine/threonine-protein kinase